MGALSMYLGIDLGTSGVKSCWWMPARHSSHSILRGHWTSRPHFSWSEQDPAIWWDGVCQTLDGLKASHPKNSRR